MPRNFNQIRDETQRRAIRRRQQERDGIDEVPGAWRPIIEPVTISHDMVMQQMMTFYHDRMRVIYSDGSLKAVPFWPEADKRRLSEWMDQEGNYKPIKELTLSELRSAIKILEHGGQSGGQESKIISLTKERERRKNVQRR